MENIINTIIQLINTKNKKPIVEWTQYQDNPISEWQHEKWKSENAFSRGMAVIAGKVWHRQDKKDYYLVALDADKIETINEICTRNGTYTDEKASSIICSQLFQNHPNIAKPVSR